MIAVVHQPQQRLHAINRFQELHRPLVEKVHLLPNLTFRRHLLSRHREEGFQLHDGCAHKGCRHSSEQVQRVDEVTVTLEHHLVAQVGREVRQNHPLVIHRFVLQIVAVVRLEPVLQVFRELALVHVILEERHLALVRRGADVHRVKQSRDVADEETKNGGADELGQDGVEPLVVGNGHDVTVPHARHRSHAPVDGGYVQRGDALALHRVRRQPVLVGVLLRLQRVPAARQQVRREHDEEEELQQPHHRGVCPELLDLAHNLGELFQARQFEQAREAQEL
mmetsp:Transcript_16617/g.54290  ORF Transcript_16617/g.54290 Transcript_16617/m.54290 type:complete len:280 (-) Transcript_16617:623-1462(-)